MTTEEKQLLLKDLSARLPYGVKGLAYIVGDPCLTNTNIVGIINSVFDLLADENPGNGYHAHDKQKATDYKNIYATESQNIDWNNSWDKGWDE